MPDHRYEPAIIATTSLGARPLHETIHLVRPSDPDTSLCGRPVNVVASPNPGELGCRSCLAVVREECSPAERVAFDLAAAAAEGSRR